MRVQPVFAKVSIFVALAASLAGLARPAQAAWPERPVTLIVAFASGSLIDVIGRGVANAVSEAIGQPVVVEPKPGAGGVIASQYVAKAPPDGYTLLLTGIGPAALRPLFDRTVGYDPVADFTPIVMTGEVPNVLIANPKLGVKTIKDLVAYARTKGGKISIGHSGIGTMGQLSALLFARQTGLDAVSVSYRGTAPMMVDVLGGRIDAGFPAFNPVTKQATILAVTTGQRVDFLPGVPTMMESGYDFNGGTWNGIFGPPHMPPDIVAKLNGAMDAYLRSPETRKRFADAGINAVGGPPDVLTKKIEYERTKWSDIIAAAKIGDHK